MAAHRHFDIIVVGGGVMGSATAWRAARKGQSVLLLEQYHFLHRRGSSHGPSRIIRRTYPQAHFVDMMEKSYVLWDEAERESGVKVFTKTGGLDFGIETDPALAELIQSCKDYKIDYEELTSAQMNERFPLTMPPNFKGVFQKDAGILHATNSVNMFHNLARACGAELHDCERVLSITPTAHSASGAPFVVASNRETYTANSVVITAGAWAENFRQLGFNLPKLEAWKMSFGYWRIKPESTEALSDRKFPIFIQYSDKMDTIDLTIYGFPIHEYPGLMKVAAHYTDEKVNADLRSSAPNQRLLNDAGAFMHKYFKGVADAPPEHVETCLYTMTPDLNFAIDTHPQYPGLVMGSACSGHGFKMAPLVGTRRVATLATHSHDSQARSSPI